MPPSAYPEDHMSAFWFVLQLQRRAWLRFSGYRLLRWPPIGRPGEVRKHQKIIKMTSHLLLPKVLVLLKQDNLIFSQLHRASRTA